MKSLVKSLLKNQGAPVAYVARNVTNPGSLSIQNPMEAYLRAYQNSGTVFGVQNVVSQPTAAVEWRMYRKNTDNRVRYSTTDVGSDQRTEVVQHQALNVLNNPNPFMTRMNLFELSQTYLDLAGESWWLLDYGNLSFPLSIWPVRPDRMVPIPDPEQFLKGYTYIGPNGEQVPFQLNEVIFVKRQNPLDPYRGQGIIQTIMADVEAGRYAAEHNRNYFYNGAEPGGIVQYPSELTDEEFDQLVNRWRESHQGVSRAHRVAILEAGATWISNHTNQKDMDFVNLVNNSRDKIREAYGVHKIMVGISDDVNRANAQTGEEVHNTWQIIPRLDKWKDALNYQFLPLFGSTGQGVEFDYIPPQPNNREQDNAEMIAKAQTAQTYINAGFEPHAVLEVVGTPDMDVIEKATQAPALPPGWVQEQQPKPAPAESETDNA